MQADLLFCPLFSLPRVQDIFSSPVYPGQMTGSLSGSIPPGRIFSTFSDDGTLGKNCAHCAPRTGSPCGSFLSQSILGSCFPPSLWRSGQSEVDRASDPWYLLRLYPGSVGSDALAVGSFPERSCDGCARRCQRSHRYCKNAITCENFHRIYIILYY